jgi:hypothetical protein
MILGNFLHVIFEFIHRIKTIAEITTIRPILSIISVIHLHVKIVHCISYFLSALFRIFEDRFTVTLED